jgi:hypothetical protein
MRTTYSSPSASRPSPPTFWKVANSEGATLSRSSRIRANTCSAERADPTIVVR